MNGYFPPYSRYPDFFGTSPFSQENRNDSETLTISADLMKRHNDIKDLLYPDHPSESRSQIFAALSSIADIFSALAPILYPRPAPAVQVNIGSGNNYSTYQSSYYTGRPNTDQEDQNRLSGTAALMSGAAGGAAVVAGANFAKRYHNEVEAAQESYDSLKSRVTISSEETTFKANLQEMNSHIITAARAKRNLIYAGVLSAAGIIMGAVKRSKQVRDISAMVTVGIGVVGVTCYIFNVFDVAKKCNRAFGANEALLASQVHSNPTPENESYDGN